MYNRAIHTHITMSYETIEILENSPLKNKNVSVYDVCFALKSFLYVS